MDICPKSEFPLPRWGNQRGGSLQRQKEGPPAETAPSALPVIWELVIGGLTSAFMVVLGS